MYKWIARSLIVCIIFLSSACNSKDNSTTSKGSEKIDVTALTSENIPAPETDALAEAEKQAIMERANLIREAEDSLAAALGEAQKHLRPEDWNKLQDAQPMWEKQKKGLDAAKLMQSGMPAEKAYEEAIMMRIRYINALISTQFLRDNIVEWQGNYPGENATVEVYWYDKTEPTHYLMIYDKNHQELFRGYGPLNENALIATDQDNDNRKIHAEFKDDSVTIRIESWDDETSRQQLAPLCGTFKRERGMENPENAQG